jgi:hypothetical protein
MAAMLAWIVMDQWIWSPGTTGRVVIASIAIVAVVVHAVRSVWPVLRSSVRADYAARALERDHPELGHALSSYVTLTAQDSANQPASKGQLSKRVVQSIGATTAAKLRSIDALPEEATGLLRWWIATIALMSVLVIYAIVSPKNALQSAARLMAPAADIRPANRVQITNVQPGDAEVLAGKTVDVSAQIRGLRDNESVAFRWLNLDETSATGNDNDELVDNRLVTEMQVDEKTADRSTVGYAASIRVSHQATGVQRYEIVAGDAVAGPFEWTIRDTPVVSVTEVQYQPPSYTGETSRVRRSGSIRGVDGTRVTLRARVNRPVARAVVEFNPKPMGQEIRATAGVREMTLSDDGTSLELPFDLRSGEVATRAVELESYRIRVWDQTEQTNSDPIIYPIEVIRDLPPEITIVVPRRTPKQVPLDAQQLFEIHAADVDFGLAEIEIEIRRGIDVIARASLWKNEAGKKGNQIAEYRFRPSRMILANSGRRGARSSRLMVGDEVEVVAIATDNRRDANNPSIQPGVTRTDPVRLQIVAGRVPEEQTPEDQDDNDGQTPDDGASPDGSGAGEDGQSGGSGGSGEGGQSEQGGQGGEGQSGAGESNSEPTGENENSGESDGNSSGSDSANGDSNPNDNTNSDSSNGNNNANSDSNDGSESGDSSNGNAGESSSDPNAMSEGSNEPTGNESGANESGANESGANESGANESGANESGANESGANESGQSEPSNGATGTGEPNQSGEDQQPSDGSPSGNQEASQQNTDQEGGEQRSSDANQQGSSGTPEGSNELDDSRTPPSAPQDDAEAFERINEYLKEQQENQPNGSPNQQPSGEQPPNQNQGGTGPDSQSNDSTANDSNQPSGDRNNETTPGENSDGPGENENALGENAADDNAPGEGSSSDKGTSESAGDESSGTEPGEPGSESADSQTGTPGQQSADSGQPQDGSSSSDDGKTAGEPGQASSSESGSQNPGEQGSSGGDDSESGAGSEQGAPNESNSASDPGGDQDSSQAGNPESSSEASSDGSQQSSSEAGDSSEFSGNSNANGNLNGNGESNTELPPADPADLEYTKRATDMVLDYLDETRQDPDPNLLDRLKWTPEDLQRFRERWQNVKPIDQPGADPNLDRSDVEEALRSLGMRAPQSMRSQSAPGQQDGLRGLQDSGNRRQAPAAVRDAFEAFRRGWKSSQ